MNPLFIGGFPTYPFLDSTAAKWFHGFSEEPWVITLSGQSSSIFASSLKELVEILNDYFDLTLLDREYLFWKLLVPSPSELTGANELRLPWGAEGTPGPTPRSHTLVEWDPRGNETRFLVREPMLLHQTPQSQIKEFFSLAGLIRHSSYEEFLEANKIAFAPAIESKVRSSSDGLWWLGSG